MLGETLALCAAMTWAVSVILFKRSEAISPQGLNLFKNVVAVVLLALTLPLLGESVDWQRSSEDWWRLGISGLLGIAIADTLFFEGLRHVGPSLLAVIELVYAPLIVALSVIVLDESIGPGFVVGAALVVGGVALTTTGAALGVGDRRRLVIGAAAGVGAVVAMALGVIIAKPALERGDLVEVTLVRLVAGIGGQLVWIVGRRTTGVLGVFRPQAVWRTLVPASVLGSYVSMLLWLGGFKWADASIASVLNQLSTVFIIVLARVVLGEVLTRRRALGAGLALAGALVVLLT